jgi:tRNA-Thr(GGU) m(6)t(6)A37 methyltransferase TsaA
MIYLYWIVFIILALSFSVPAESGPYSIQPVGRVVKSEGKTTLAILPHYQGALLGLQGFSHLLVFFWFDQNDTPEKRATLQVHPRGNQANPLTGVFATRSPQRPNLIGFSVCRIKSIDGCLITIDDIDAFDGTPIIDLKPYIPASDSFPEAQVPEWIKK